MRFRKINIYKDEVMPESRFPVTISVKNKRVNKSQAGFIPAIITHDFFIATFLLSKLH